MADYVQQGGLVADAANDLELPAERQVQHQVTGADLLITVVIVSEFGILGHEITEPGKAGGGLELGRQYPGATGGKED